MSEARAAVAAEPVSASPAGPADAATPQAAQGSRRALLLWSAFTLCLTVLGCWLLYGSTTVRLWYYDHRFTRATEDGMRRTWARRIAALPSEAATATLRAHALSDHEDRAFDAAAALMTGLCPGADDAFSGLMREWPPERQASYTWFMLRATGKDKDLLPMMLKPGVGLPAGAPAEGKKP